MPEDRRDIRVERVLDRLQIQYTFEPDFPLADIIRPEEGTQVRASTGSRAVIDEYTVAYESGAEFPPLLIHAKTKKLIDGNTRYAAATKARVQAHPIYLVDARTPRLAEIVQGAMNQLNGERLSNEQAIETAKLMHQQGYKPDEIARSTGRRISTVQETLKAIEFEERAATLGLPVETLPKNVKTELSGIQLDRPLAMVTQAVASKNIPREEVRDLKNRLAETHSEAEAVGLVEKQLESWDASATPPHNDRPKEKGRPIRQAAETLATKIEKVRWDLLADADYRETVASLKSVSTAIATIPVR
jgi:ParB-like chromosome segregation protein Spo0J